MSAPPRLGVFAVALTTALATLDFLTRAWVTEDAYLTFRTIDNFVNGYGLRWNVDERVQAYTHPLWMLINVPLYALTHDVVVSVIAVSLACAGVAVGLVARRLGAASVLLLPAILLSKCVTEFATSGLEGPLGFALGAAFLYEAGGRGRVRALALITALAATNRQDHVLIYAPALLALAAAEVRAGSARRVLADLVIGFTPLLAWEAFSLFYYGSLYPNTAYAKLNTGLGAADFAPQGLAYFVDFVNRDPASAAVLVSGVVAGGWAVGAGDRRLGGLAVGLAVYAAYVVRVGGDFMSGRFFAVPTFVALALLAEVARVHLPRRVAVTGAIGLSALLLLAFPRSATFAVPTGTIPPTGIVDERLAYVDTNAIERLSRTNSPETHAYSRDGRVARREGAAAQAAGHAFVVQAITVGMLGYYAGPDVVVIDAVALGDPLLARLPMDDARTWRVGHYARYVPRGYLKYRGSGDASDMDPALARYMEHVRLVISGDLTDPARLAAIVSWNLGLYDADLDDYVARRAASVDRTVVDRDATRDATSITTGGGVNWGSVTVPAAVSAPASASAPAALPAVAAAGVAAAPLPGAASVPAGADLPLASVSTPRPARSRWDAPGNVVIPVGGAVRFVAPAPMTARSVEVAADANDEYLLRFYVGTTLLGEARAPRDGANGPGLTLRQVALPDAMADQKFDRIEVSATGDAALSIGHLLFR